MAGGRQLQPDGAVLDKILGTKRSLLVLPPDDQPRGPSRLAKAQKVRVGFGSVFLNTFLLQITLNHSCLFFTLKIIQATEELAKEENNCLHLELCNQEGKAMIVSESTREALTQGLMLHEKVRLDSMYYALLPLHLMYSVYYPPTT